MLSAQSPLTPLAAAIAPGRGDFVDALVSLTEREISELNHHDDLRRHLRGSIEENVDRLIEALPGGLDPRGTAVPDAALEYAEQLARTNASLASLLRAYRIGQAQFTAHCLEVGSALPLPLPPTVQIEMVNLIATYIDHVCEEVTEVYQAEREKWLGGQQGLRLLWVSRLLADASGVEVDQGEASRALGYDLSATHCAVEMWVDRADRAGRINELSAAEALNDGVAAVQSVFGTGGRLAVPRSDRDLWLWFRVSAGLDIARAISKLPQSLPVRVAVGSPASGAAGFRTSHRRATRVRELMQHGPDDRPVAAWAELAPIALLTWSGEDAPDLITDTLGALAGDDPRLAELRETLRVFLEHNRSFAVSADILHVHRNTVRYRVHQALELCGTQPDGHTFDLLSALNAARWS